MANSSINLQKVTYNRYTIIKRRVFYFLKIQQVKIFIHIEMQLIASILTTNIDWCFTFLNANINKLLNYKKKKLKLENKN